MFQARYLAPSASTLSAPPALRSNTVASPRRATAGSALGGSSILKSSCRPALKAAGRRRAPPPQALHGDTRAELPKYLTLVGYGALQLAHQANLGSFAITSDVVYNALTWYTLFWAVLSTVDERFRADSRMGAIVGPIFLAVTALGGLGGRISSFKTAAAVFGWCMVDQLPSFQYSRWVWSATLAAAIYNGMPAQWLVAAFGLSSLWRLVEQKRSDNRVRVQDVAFAAFAGWAFYAQAEVQVSLIMMAAYIAAAAFTAAAAVVE